MWLTFDGFACSRMIKPQKGANSTVTIAWLIWKLKHLVITPWLAILMITVCWGNWNVSPHAGCDPVESFVNSINIRRLDRKQR